MGDVKFSSGVDMSGFERDLGGMQGKLGKFNAATVAAISRFAAPAALAAGIGAIGKAAIENADRIQDLADRYKTTADAVQRVGAVAKVMGTDVESSLASVKRLKVALVDAADGGKEQNDALQAMGLRVEELQDLDLPDLLARVAEGYERAELSGRGLHAITKLMGRSADELIPLLTQGSAALKEMFDSATVASDDRVKDLADLADGWEALKTKAMAYATEGLGAVLNSWTRLMELTGRRNMEDFAATSMGGGQEVPQWGPDATPEEQARLMGEAAPSGFKAGEESAADAAERERMSREKSGAEWLGQEEARQKAAADAAAEQEDVVARAKAERQEAFEQEQRRFDLEMQIANLRGTSEQRAQAEAILRLHAAREELRLATGTAEKKAAALAVAQAEASIANGGPDPGASKEERTAAYLDQGMTISQARRAVRQDDKRQRSIDRRKDRLSRTEGDQGSLFADRPEDRAGYIQRGNLVEEYGPGQGTRPGDVIAQDGAPAAGSSATPGATAAGVTASESESGGSSASLTEMLKELQAIHQIMSNETE